MPYVLAATNGGDIAVALFFPVLIVGCVIAGFLSSNEPKPAPEPIQPPPPPPPPAPPKPKPEEPFTKLIRLRASKRLHAVQSNLPSDELHSVLMEIDEWYREQVSALLR